MDPTLVAATTARFGARVAIFGFVFLALSLIGALPPRRVPRGAGPDLSRLVGLIGLGIRLLAR